MISGVCVEFLGVSGDSKKKKKKKKGHSKEMVCCAGNGLFRYLIIYTPADDNNIGICPGGWSFKCLSWGLEGMIEACPGGMSPGRGGGGGGSRYNKSLSRGAYIYCSWGVHLQLLSSVGVICNNVLCMSIEFYLAQ